MNKQREIHNNYQRDIFAEEVSEFCVPIPEEIQRRLESIVAKVGLTQGEQVLDVGTGTGVLIPYIRSYALDSIVGCDISPTMLAEAARRHPDLSFWCGDVVDLPADLGPFDVVFLNAMFGNVWDQQQTLTKATALLNPGGRICISHPLGSRYVAELRRSDPERTPHTLPDREVFSEWLGLLPLELIYYEDGEVLYLAVLRKV